MLLVELRSFRLVYSQTLLIAYSFAACGWCRHTDFRIKMRCMEIRFYVMVFGDESGLIESPILGIIYTSLLKQGLLILS